MVTKGDMTATALCECGACGETFAVPADPRTGFIDIEAAAEHGEEHPDEWWNYEIVERPGGTES